jgi:hypothetical protein
MIITNLLQILFKAPQIIGIIKAILDIVGSEQVQKILEALRTALIQEVPNPAIPPKTEPERERLIQRFFRRLTLNHLGMSEQAYNEILRDQHLS